MVCCYECGMQLKSRERDGEIQVYDLDKRAWTDECPFCGRIGFDDDDYIDEDEEDDDEYEDEEGLSYHQNCLKFLRCLAW